MIATLPICKNSLADFHDVLDETNQLCFVHLSFSWNHPTEAIMDIRCLRDWPKIDEGSELQLEQTTHRSKACGFGRRMEKAGQLDINDIDNIIEYTNCN